MSDINFWIAQYPMYAAPPINPPTAPIIMERMRTITNNIILIINNTTLVISYTSFVVNIFQLVRCVFDLLVYLATFYILINFLM